MHPAGLEPATCNLEGCCSIPTELRMLTIGLEPILPKGTDFKSVVFTNFTKRALGRNVGGEKKNPPGVEVCSVEIFSKNLKMLESRFRFMVQST